MTRRTGGGTFRALRVRNFRLYASANLVSQTGTWMQRVGQAWLVLQLSGDDGVALGVATSLQFLPTMFLSFYGGVLADRFDKRRLLVLTQALMGLLALVLGLLVLTDAVRLWHVFVLAAGLGVVASFDTPARQAFVSEMVGPELLTNAVSLNSTVFNGGRLVGPAVAGGLIAASSGDTAAAFLLNAVSFACTIAALLAMRTGELRPSALVPRARGQLREALAYTRARPDLRLAMLLAFVLGTFGFNSQILVPLMAREEFGLGASAYGLLSTCFAAGSLSGALLSGRRTERPRRRFLLGTAALMGVALIVAGLMPTYATFAVALVPTGAMALLFSVACNSFVQLGVDPQMRGRVLALYFTAFMGGTPLGGPAVGWVAERYGAPWGLMSGGIVCLVAAVAAAGVLLRDQRRTVLPPDDAAPAVPAVGRVLAAQSADRTPGEQQAQPARTLAG